VTIFLIFQGLKLVYWLLIRAFLRNWRCVCFRQEWSLP